MLPASNDTLLRVIRKQGHPPFIPPAVIGIDDWAWRRNQRYGTLICDLAKRQTICPTGSWRPASSHRHRGSPPNLRQSQYWTPFDILGQGFGEPVLRSIGDLPPWHGARAAHAAGAAPPHNAP